MELTVRGAQGWEVEKNREARDPTPSFAGTEAGNLTPRGAAESDP